MSISVLDAMQLKQLKPLELVAGNKGLHKMIDKIGILDHEIVEGIVNGFVTGDFVLTTFTAARNDVNIVEQCVRDLITCNVSALAIKKVYYHELPEHIIKLADDGGLPIFMFEEDVFFENIIEDLMRGMQTRSHMELLSSKIEIMFKNALRKPVVLELAYELNRSFDQTYQVIYCKEKRYRNDENILMLSERYHRSRTRSIHHSVIKYNEGLIIILTYKKITEQSVRLDLNHIFKQLNMNKEEYVIGFSCTGDDLNTLNAGIKESIYATEAADIMEKPQINYDEIGLYKILLPYAKDKWVIDFSNTILNPIKAYDDGKLYETAQMYIKTKGNVIQTAEALFQHKNTIRYRLNKMQEILSLPCENDFYEQLSIAIKCDLLS